MSDKPAEVARLVAFLALDTVAGCAPPVFASYADKVVAYLLVKVVISARISK